MEFLGNAKGTELVFWLAAIAGTLFFFLRVALMIVGGYGDDVSDDISDADLDDDGSDASFKLLSLNSITGFIMMFGWSGLASYVQFQLSEVISYLIAIVVGTICMFITAMLFKLATKLTSPGARFNIQKTLNVTGEVYLNIPASGVGKVKITVEGESNIIDAISEDKTDIESFKNVQVVRVVNPKTVSVKEI